MPEIMQAPPGERSERSGAAQRRRWPYADASPVGMPDALPDGRPWPRVSIVTPSFNQGRYIEETILSVLHQGYPDVEHIVIDGASTDDTGHVLDRYADRLACVVREPDDGQSDALNKGFARATGEIMTWLNADDMLAPGALASAALALHTSGADMIAGECHIYRDGALEHRHLTSCADGPLPLDDLLDLEHCWIAGQFFYQPEVLFTRDLWRRAGAHVSTDWHYSMDYELWLRFAQAGARLHVIGRPIAHFRAHDEQKTADEDGQGYRAELPRVAQAFRQRTEREEPPPREPARRRTLRIVLFNDIGYKYGAGIGHRRIAEALTMGGHDVRAVAAEDLRWATADHILASINSHVPDLVVVGNIHAAYLPSSIVGRIAERYPTIFMLHDLWMLTGGCAYPSTCTRFTTGCGPGCTCPDAYPKVGGPDLTRQWEAKHRVLSSAHAPALFANSRWTRRIIEQCTAVDGSIAAPVSWIKFGLEQSAFRPRDKGTCRDLLGLERDRFIIMTSASSIADERKGVAHLAEAVTMLDMPDCLVICTGAARSDEAPTMQCMRFMGYVDDPVQLSLMYNAADIFVGPSLEEAFGQVFVEAAACATPSVGYPVGGVPEAILDGVSGRLAETVSPVALASAIRELYEDDALRLRMGLTARLWAQNTWSMSASFARFVQALREVGLEDRLGLSRKISLALDAERTMPPPPAQASAQLPFWTAVSGCAMWEGPIPEVKLGRFRWALGPVTRFQLHAARGGRHVIALRVRNFHTGQGVRVTINGSAVRRAAVPVTNHESEHLVRIEGHLEPGENTVELTHSKWNTDNPSRPLALLIADMQALRIDDP